MGGRGAGFYHTKREGRWVGRGEGRGGGGKGWGRGGVLAWPGLFTNPIAMCILFTNLFTNLDTHSILKEKKKARSCCRTIPNFVSFLCFLSPESALSFFF